MWILGLKGLTNEEKELSTHSVHPDNFSPFYSGQFSQTHRQQTQYNPYLHYIDNSITDNSLGTTGVDPGFFLGGGALVSCSTLTPINHILFFFFGRIPVVLKNRRSSQGGGCAPPAPSPQICPCTKDIEIYTISYHYDMRCLPFVRKFQKFQMEGKW